MAEELLPCPFCGGTAEIIDIEEGENAGGSCVSCTRCLASSNVEFEFKENYVSNWNRRFAHPVPEQDGWRGPKPDRIYTDRHGDEWRLTLIYDRLEDYEAAHRASRPEQEAV